MGDNISINLGWLTNIQEIIAVEEI